MNLKKIVSRYGIFIALFFLIISGSTFYLEVRNEQKTIDSGTGWPTYTNSKYNFSLQYPRDWYWAALPNGRYLNNILNLIYFHHGQFPNLKDEEIPDLTFITTDQDPANWRDWQEQNFQTREKTAYKLGSYPATKIIGFSKLQDEDETVVIAKVNSLYFVAIGNNSTYAKTYLDLILSTFKISTK